MVEKKSLLESRPDYLVCTCMGVMYSDICKAIKDGNTTFESLEEMLMIGSGCSSCVEEVHEILDKSSK